jgi:hypothetical protein
MMGSILFSGWHQISIQSFKTTTTVRKLIYINPLLAKNLVQPVAMELFVCNVDGSDMRQLTTGQGKLGALLSHPRAIKLFSLPITPHQRVISSIYTLLDWMEQA